MRIRFIAFFLVIATLIFQSAASSYVAHAAVPQLIGYEGRLTNASGTELNGSYAMTFRIYDAANAGTLLWSETQPAVTAAKGYFSVQLGSVTPFPSSLNFDSSYWVSLEVQSDGEMSPRQPISSVGYALTSDKTLGVVSLASAPSSPVGGQLYYNTGDGNVYSYDAVGAAWVDLTGGGGGGAPVGAQYLVTSSDGTLTNEIVASSLSGNLSFQGDDAAARTITLGQTNAFNDLVVIDAGNFSLNAAGDIAVSGAANFNGTITVGDAPTDAVTFNAVIQGANPFVFEGSVVNANKLTVAVAEPTGSNVITLPDATGTVITTGNLSAITSVGNDSVALGTSTTGNYVANVTAGTGVAVTGSAGEGWSPTVALTGQALALNNLASNGFFVRTGTGTVAARSVTGGTGISVTNGDGVAANPSVALADTAVTPGAYGAASSVSTFTVDQQGRLTAAGSTAIAIAANQITSGVMSVVQGGTGIATIAAGQLVYGSAADTMSALTGPSGANQVLRSTGANAFAWGGLQAADLPAGGYDSTYVNASGDTLGGNLDFGNNLATNIGNAGTDFTAGGGLTLAGDLVVNGGDVTSSGALTVTPNAGSNLNISLSTTGDFAVNTNQLYVDTSTGFVGVGNAAPAALFSVGSSSQFQVSAAGAVTASNFSGSSSGTNTGDQTTITGNAGTATALQTARSIYGNSFDGTAALSQVIASTFGGTGNGFTKFSGPTTAEKTFILPDASATLLYAGGALGTPASATLTNATGLPIAGLVSSTSTALGLGSIELGNASDTTIARSSAGVVSIEGANVLVSGGPLGTPASGVATNLTGTASGLTAGSVTNATLSTALTVNTGTVTLVGNAANTSALTIGAGAVSVSGTNTGDQTTITGNAGTATALQNARTIGGVSFDGTANITVASATGGFAVSGAALAVNSGDITSTGALTVTPASGSNLNISLATTGDFAVNANQLYVDTSTGNVGIGDATPAAALAVGSGDLFQVNSSGAIAASTAIANSGAYVQSGVSANTFTGATSFTAAGTALSVTNNASVGGSLTSPVVIGGSGVASTLILRSTSGIGTTGADVIIQTGNNGSTEAGRFPNVGGFKTGTNTNALTQANGVIQADNIGINTGGNNYIKSDSFEFGSKSWGRFAVWNGLVFQFSSTAATNGTPDLGFARNAAGVLEINSGTAGALRDLTLRGTTATGGYVQSGASANTLSGATSFTAAGTALSVTNNATIGGTLGVTGTISASNFSGSSSGTNTGDQTSVTGNAGTATALQTARSIGGVSFDGTADITVASATGGFAVSGAALAVDSGSITSLGALTVTPNAGSNLNISLATTGDFAVNTNQLYVDTSTGRVGIGTDTPGQKLEVGGNIVVNSTSNYIGVVDNTHGALRNRALWLDDASTITTSSTFGANSLGYYGYFGHSWRTTNAASVTADRMFLDREGRLGIGDSSPAALLTVGSGDLFQIDSSGAIAASTGIANSGAYVQSGTSANTLTGATSFTAAGTALSVTNDATIGGTLGVTGTISASNFSGSSSGTNTGDQTTITGNAGTATALQNARTIAGTSFDGTANISLANKFIVQGTSDAGLSAAQFLGSLGTGIVKNTTTTGVLSIATGADLPVMTATVGGAVPTPPNNTTTFLRGDGTFATPAGSGDMVLASVQTNSGAKTFLDTTLLLRNVANTFNGSFVNTNTADRVYTLPDASAALLYAGGPLGTPASGVATNLTGTASGLTAGSVTNATLSTALTVNTGTVTLVGNAANTSALTIGAGAVSVSGTNTGDQTTITGNAGTATALQNARTIGGVSFDGTANITVASATGGFAVSGAALAVNSGDITSTGALTVTPASGSNLNISLATTGDFAVNANQLYVDTSTGNVGIGDATPGAKLEVTSGVADTSGLRFTNLTSASAAAGAGTKVLSVDGSGNVVLVTDATGGSGTPAGADTEIQFNNSGAFGASSNLTWNGSVLGVTGGYTQSGAGANTFTGASSFTSAGTALSVTNDAIIGGNLTIGATPSGFANTPLHIDANVNSYLQANIQNDSAGASASSDWVATADNGNDTTNYIDMGINSSGYSDANYTSGDENDSYLYANGGKMTIGTQTAGEKVQIIAGGTKMANVVGTFYGYNATADSGQLELVGGLQTPYFRTGPTDNYLLQSASIDNASWTKTGTTITADNVAAPRADSGNVADLLNAGGASTDGATQAVANSTLGNWSFSVWLRAASELDAFINLTTNTESFTQKRVHLSTQWQRFYVSRNFTVAHATKTVAITNGTSAIFAWGAQLNPTSYPLTYSETVAAAITTRAYATTTDSPFVVNGTTLTTGYAQKLNVNGAAVLTTGGALDIDGPTGAATMNATTGLLNISSTGAITNSTTGAGSGTLLQVTGNGAITPTLASISDTSVMTTTGKLLDLTANAATTTTGLLTMNAQGLTTGYAQAINVNGAAVLTTGGALRVTGPTGAASLNATTGLVSITAAGAITNTTAGAASGSLFQITANAAITPTLASISDTAVMTTTGKLLDLTANAATTTTGLLTMNAQGLTTGYAQRINVNGAAVLTTGGALNINGPTGAAVMDGTTGLVNISASGAITNSTTGAGSGTLLQVLNNAAITSTLASISDTGAMTTTGKLLDLTANGATTTTGLLTMNSTGLTTGRAINSTMGGGLTTGGFLNVTGASYAHTVASDLGTVANISFTDASNSANSSQTDGVLVTQAANTAGAGTKTLAGFEAKNTITACTAGPCIMNGFLATTATTNFLSTVTQNGVNVVGTGVSTGTLNGINVAAITGAAGTETAINIGSGWDNVLSVNGVAVINGSGSINATSISSGTLAVANGGTGANSFTSNGILYGNGAGAVQVTAAGGVGTLCLTSTNGGTPVFGACSGSAATAWDALTAPSTNLGVAMADKTTTFTWNAATGASNLFSLTDTASNSGTGYLFDVATASSSSAKPFRVSARGTAIIDTTAAGGITLSTPSGSGEAIAYTSDIATTIATRAGNVILQAAGTGTTGNVQIGAGNGGAGSTTPDLLVLDGKSTTGDPAGVDGAMYYNVADGVFRCKENGTWKNCINSGASGGVTLGPGSADTLAGANSGIQISHTGTGNLLELEKSGVDRFVVGNGGGLTINGSDSSVVRTTSADFSLGTVGSGLDNANGQLELSNGTVPNSGKGTITTAGQPTTSAAIGAGAMAITRPDGKYLVIRGGGTGMDVYDSIAGTSTNFSQVTTGNVGAGSLVLPRPDGRFLIVHGGGLTTSTLIDPQGTFVAQAGPTVVASNAGTVAYRRPDGRFLYTNGGAGTTQIYDPVANTIATGPSLTTGTAAAGSLLLPLPDGRALLVVGGATGNSQLYTPSSGTANIGVFAAGPTLGTGCEINGSGSAAFRRQDGKYVVLSKASASTVYDPVANTFTCSTSNGPAAALGNGAHAISMQNGKFLIIRGGNTQDSYVYDPSDDSYTAHGTNLTAVSTGGFSLMRADGTWQIFSGAGTATNNFDTGLPMFGTAATYTSDDITTTSLNASSTLKWTAQFESPYTGTNASTNTAFSTLQFFVRTAANAGALGAAVDREIQNIGDLIRPASTDTAIRVTVKFNRPVPERIIDDRGVWMGNSKTAVRFDYTTPTLFDFSIDNSAALRRSASEFALPNANVAAPQTETSGPVMTRAEATSAGLQLPYGRLLMTSLVGTTEYYLGLMSPAHPNITQAQTNDGTIVIARPNKTFVIIANLTSPAANASLYDPASQTFTAQAGSNIPTAANAAGGFAVKRPDGKFLVVLGGGTATNIYNPDDNTFVSGPALSASAGIGASAIPNADGSFTIVHGAGATTSTIYDPVRNTMVVGPTLTTAANCGFWAIPLQNGMYKTFVGVASGVVGVTTSMNYNPITKVFTAGTALTGNHGCGSFVFQRADGFWVSVAAAGAAAGGGSTVTSVINPLDGTSIAGPATSAAAGRGSYVIPRADGTFLIVHGNNTTSTSVYIPTGSTFGVGAGIGTMGTGPVTPGSSSQGALAFQRPDGKWVMIVGNATATTNLYDAGWYSDGQYLSEQMQVPALAANSTIEWKQTGGDYVRMEVRYASSQAALSTASYYSVGRSGQSIANAGSETWVQVQINFRRDLPTFSGALNGVYASGGGMVYPYRAVTLPTITEYKINNGMDLMTLQDNGLNVFRVTTAGNVYTSAGGGFYSGGADLAERYTSSDYLEPGDVVIADYSNNHGVKKSSGQYQTGLLGVVSTAPGFVAGAYTTDSYPIALVGRVPVKVSTENGPVVAGDYLTSASIPGYAMKATFAGRIIGQALENLTVANQMTCPGVALGLKDTTKCGTAMMFVNLVDYKGISVDVALKDWKDAKTATAALAATNGLEVSGTTVADTGAGAVSATEGVVTPAVASYDDEVLAFLQNLKTEREASLNEQSDLFANKVRAISEIIAPRMVADVLNAREANLKLINGFTIITENLTAKNLVTAGLASANGKIGFRFNEDGSMVIYAKKAVSVAAPAPAEGQEAAAPTVQNVDTDVVTFDTEGKAAFAGDIIAKGIRGESLTVAGSTVLSGALLVETIGTDASSISIMGQTTFFGRPYFMNDMGGTAIIKKDAREVEVTFEREYVEIPTVVASIAFVDDPKAEEDVVKKNEELTAQDKAKDIKLDKEGKPLTALAIKENSIFDNAVQYVVTARTVKGFKIILNKDAADDITFSWIAIAIKDAKTFTSREKTVPVEPAPVVETPAPAVTETPAEAPVVTETPVTSETPAPTPAETPAAETPAPAVETPVATEPVPTEPASVETPAPAETAPVAETPVVTETPAEAAPAATGTAPAAETPAPAVEASAPAASEPASQPAPVEAPAPAPAE